MVVKEKLKSAFSRRVEYLRCDLGHVIAFRVNLGYTPS